MAEQIDKSGGIVAYTQRDYELPSLDLIRIYQNIVKTFCTDPLTMRKDFITFYNEPTIVFYNEDRCLVAIFNKETKIFKSAYKISRNEFDEFVKTQTLGKPKQNNNLNDLVEHEEL